MTAVISTGSTGHEKKNTQNVYDTVDVRKRHQTIFIYIAVSRTILCAHDT